MKHFKMTYNGTKVGVFSEYQLLNEFEDYEWQFIVAEQLYKLKIHDIKN